MVAVANVFDVLEIIHAVRIFPTVFRKKTKPKIQWDILYGVLVLTANIFGFIGFTQFTYKMSITYWFFIFYSNFFLHLSGLLDLQFHFEKNYQLLEVLKSMQKLTNYLSSQTSLNFYKLAILVKLTLFTILLVFTSISLHEIYWVYGNSQLYLNLWIYCIGLVVFYYYYIWTHVGIIYCASILAIKAYQNYQMSSVQLNLHITYRQFQLKGYEDTIDLFRIFGFLILVNLIGVFSKFNITLTSFWQGTFMHDLYLLLWLGLLSGFCIFLLWEVVQNLYYQVR